jgi:hypothetical protein
MEIYSFIRKIDRPVDMGGWGNGYVAIPQDHPFFGTDYMEIDDLIDIHGGLTFSRLASVFSEELLPFSVRARKNEFWVFGFDTMHCDDNLGNWPIDKVLEETKKLEEQLANFAIKRTGYFSKGRFVLITKNNPIVNFLKYVFTRKT